jgi:hypothetical protein
MEERNGVSFTACLPDPQLPAPLHLVIDGRCDNLFDWSMVSQMEAGHE